MSIEEQKLLKNIFGEQWQPTEKDLQMEGKRISIEYCSTCGFTFVRCPRCGNNSCNAGYGEDGKCPICPKAYDLQKFLDSQEDLMQELLLGGKAEKMKKKEAKYEPL